jgi:GAF domain-containing protein
MGLIGELMCGSESIRLKDISADPRSVGFPDNHPQMKSFLGVPIRQGNKNWASFFFPKRRMGLNLLKKTSG